MDGVSASAIKLFDEKVVAFLEFFYFLFHKESVINSFLLDAVDVLVVPFQGGKRTKEVASAGLIGVESLTPVREVESIHRETGGSTMSQ